LNELESSILRTIIDTANDHFFIVKADGRVHDVSPGAAAVYGMPRDELCHSSVQELEAKGILNPPVSLEVLRTGKPAQLVQHTTTGRRVIAQAHPVFLEGKLVCVVSRSMDLTDLQLLQDEYALLQKRLNEHLKGSRHNSGDDLDLEVALSRLEVSSEVMREVALLLKRVAPTDANVLIFGETGVGKTVFARQLHQWSLRHKGPFIDVNCGAIPENLFESEMFGYRQGAFSGAAPNGKVGLIESAQEGTLFLDEIGELPLEMQAKLLKVIQDGLVTRLGDTSPRRVNFRLVAATNQDLWHRVELGQFRLDLYYRLNVIPVTLPPLRERKEDIPALVERQVERLNQRYGRQKLLAGDAWEELMTNAWPGNVRELENWLERAWLSAANDMIHSQRQGVINDSSMEPVISPHANHSNQKPTFDVDEMPVHGLPPHETLKQAVERTESNIFATLCRELPSTYAIAKRLGISQPSVVRKLKRYGLIIENVKK
jgi:TyrR family helix-turn-helix protein/PAS domain S-box-containing protein